MFCGDADFLASGLACASSIRGSDLVLGKLTSDELNARDDGLIAFARRVGIDLGRDDLRAVLLLCAESRTPSNRDMSFQEFRRIHQPPVFTYRCISCEGGEAANLEQMTPEAFLTSGGRLLLLEGLKLVGQDDN